MNQREVKLLEVVTGDVMESLEQSSLQWNESGPVEKIPEQGGVGDRGAEAAGGL